MSHRSSTGGEAAMVIPCILITGAYMSAYTWYNSDHQAC